MILREVWKKGKIQDKGIHFQTPFTYMRIHWETGVLTYSSAQEAYKELKRRGFQVEEPVIADEGNSTESRLRELLGWQPATSSGPIVALRAKAKLQEFQSEQSN
ncbi:hypothetical protein cypCar_00038637 [Cyprinus carpio]|nr:hypothetical protein cypCar_00038637 [Cyprinus carpio]